MFYWIRAWYTYGSIASDNRMVNSNWLNCNSCWVYVAGMLNLQEVHNMTIVVKRVPKVLRGIVKFLFKIKD